MEQINIGWWVLVLIVGIIFFVFLGNKMMGLLKYGWYGIVHLMIGFVFIFLLNMVTGQLFDFIIPINLITALTVGFLGFPGLISLILIKIFIVF